MQSIHKYNALCFSAAKIDGLTPGLFVVQEGSYRTALEYMLGEAYEKVDHAAACSRLDVISIYPGDFCILKPTSLVR